MNCYLIIDFGASRVKSAIADLDSGEFSSLKSIPSLGNCSRSEYKYEISSFGLQKQFHNICSLYYRELGYRLKGIIVCSQMHGFILLDRSDKPISNYISWKDERSLIKIKGKDSFTILNDEFGNDYKRITGMTLSPGVPFANIIHLAREGVLKNHVKIVTLPEWFNICCSKPRGVVHVSMFAGLGFYDIRKGEESKILLDYFLKISKTKLRFNKLVKEGSVSGLFAGKIPIFVGVGDLQCAVLGAGNRPYKNISVNIGTGSQVSIIVQDINKNSDTELRPYFDNYFLKTITHIPAGRVILEFLSILNISDNKAIKENDIYFWDILSRITIKDIQQSTLNFDLNTFKSSWEYNDGGKITNIQEGSFTPGNYMASLLRCLASQYLGAIKVLEKSRKIESIILSGGIPRKFKQLAVLISNSTKLNVVSSHGLIDETLLGLRSLVLVSAGHILNFNDAQEYFKNKIIVK